MVGWRTFSLDSPVLKCVALVLALVVFWILVSPVVDLDPTTLAQRAHILPCVQSPAVVPIVVIQQAPTVVSVLPDKEQRVTDLTCERLI